VCTATDPDTRKRSEVEEIGEKATGVDLSLRIGRQNTVCGSYIRQSSPVHKQLRSALTTTQTPAFWIRQHHKIESGNCVDRHFPCRENVPADNQHRTAARHSFKFHNSNPPPPPCSPNILPKRKPTSQPDQARTPNRGSPSRKQQHSFNRRPKISNGPSSRGVGGQDPTTPCPRVPVPAYARSRRR
jgi:hypothetical protein